MIYLSIVDYGLLIEKIGLFIKQSYFFIVQEIIGF